ncbi:regenerating islet-derived protein 3-gamma-like isoform X2 [Sorex fumeus]|uniref:regenerating islet-derived protein 3-gamma-like isoform X2 n=1 Tax=Sorex fumeus TaxID=62283 RepID=UPI0024ACE3CF|nr:regenerating islet-derived protein 3-gamma-like isoform X2 [Sorex fumeus]
MASVVFANVAWMLLSCLMLQCQVKGEDLQKKKTSEKINCPSGSLSYVSNCYALFLSPKTWMDANGLQPNGNGWEWINHDVLNYRAWEKHNSSTAPGYCGSLSATSNYEQWRDYDCDKLLPYVCKFKN